MKQENTSQMTTANHWEDGPPFTTTLLISLILIAIVFVGSISYLLPMPFMDSGGKTDHFIKQQALRCQPLDVQAKQPSTTERQNDYLICLEKETKK